MTTALLTTYKCFNYKNMWKLVHFLIKITKFIFNIIKIAIFYI